VDQCRNEGLGGDGLVSPSCLDSLTIEEGRCRVVSNEWVNPEYKHMVVEARPRTLAVEPGQFFHLACPATAVDQPFLRRPMSLYRVRREEGCVEFLYKVQGAGTRGLATLRPGDELDVLGPLGKGFDLADDASHVLILARGVGLATLNPLAENAARAGKKVTAILSARTPELVMSAEALRALGVDVHTVADSVGTSGVEQIRALLSSVHSASPVNWAATCGSNRLMLLLQDFAREHGIAAQVAMEQHMGCALGMCFACVRPLRREANSDQLTYRRVCWDGPVFDLQEALSW